MTEILFRFLGSDDITLDGELHGLDCKIHASSVNTDGEVEWQELGGEGLSSLVRYMGGNVTPQGKRDAVWS